LIVSPQCLELCGEVEPHPTNVIRSVAGGEQVERVLE
jgi:hypothetical protein